MTPGIDFQIIEQPYNDLEIELVRQIEAIHREARDRAEPLIKALAWSRRLKPPTYYMIKANPPGIHQASEDRPDPHR
jgi:hypothetical protein